MLTFWKGFSVSEILVGHDVRLSELLEATRRWNEWYSQSQESGIKALRQFAEKLKGYVAGIVASATHRLNTSVLIGVIILFRMIFKLLTHFRIFYVVSA